jgi:hypothetical protein
VNFNLHSQSEKPDLIITDVEFKYERPNRQHKPGDPIRGSDNLPEPIFYITIENIGNKDLAEPFYLAFTNDENDITKGRYSHLTVVNSENNIIRANDSIKFKIGWYIDRDRNHFKFCILNDPKDFKNHMFPPIEEERYDNNTYECSILNIK